MPRRRATSVMRPPYRRTAAEMMSRSRCAMGRAWPAASMSGTVSTCSRAAGAVPGKRTTLAGSSNGPAAASASLLRQGVAAWSSALAMLTLRRSAPAGFTTNPAPRRAKPILYRINPGRRHSSHHRHPHAPRPQDAQQAHAIEAGQDEVQQHAVERFGLDAPQGGVAVLRDLAVMSEVGEGRNQTTGLKGIVFDNENTRAHGTPHQTADSPSFTGDG